MIAESRGPVREVRAVKDEEYLYLLLRLDRPESWRGHAVTIGLDTRPGGNRGLPNHPGVFPSADVALVVGPDHAQLFQAPGHAGEDRDGGFEHGGGQTRPRGLTKVAALDYAGVGVRVNAIAPGPILTANLKRAGAAAQQAAGAAMPLQRVGQPEEVASEVVWLCSGAAGFITGTTLTIDGGKLAGTPPFQGKAGPR